MVPLETSFTKHSRSLLRALEVPAKPIEPRDAGREERIGLHGRLFAHVLAGIHDPLHLPVVVLVDLRDFLLERVESLLGLEEPAIGAQRPDVGLLFAAEIADDLSANLAVVEELKLRSRPVEDVF